MSQTDPAFETHERYWDYNCELPWNYNVPANVPKILSHSINFSIA